MTNGGDTHTVMASPASGLTAEQRLRNGIKDILGSETIKSYRRLNISYTLRDTAFIYLLLIIAIGGSCYMHLQLGPIAILTIPIFALISGVAFNWINVQIHEASHGLLLPDRRWNDIYVNVVLGALGLQDVETYRATHGMHHAHLHSERDPDLWIYTTNVGSYRALARGILDDLLLMTVWRRRSQIPRFIADHDVAFAGVPLYVTLAKIGAQLIVLASFVYLAGLWGFFYYGAVYLFGLLGVFPVLVRIRTVVQHYDDVLTDDTPPDPLYTFISRTTVAPVLEFILVGARMDYHFEHHLFPTLPYYNLREMHEALKAKGFFARELQGGGPVYETDNYLKTYVDFSR